VKLLKIYRDFNPENKDFMGCYLTEHYIKNLKKNFFLFDLYHQADKLLKVL